MPWLPPQGFWVLRWRMGKQGEEIVVLDAVFGDL